MRDLTPTDDVAGGRGRHDATCVCAASAYPRATGVEKRRHTAWVQQRGQHGQQPRDHQPVDAARSQNTADKIAARRGDVAGARHAHTYVDRAPRSVAYVPWRAIPQAVFGAQALRDTLIQLAQGGWVGRIVVLTGR